MKEKIKKSQVKRPKKELIRELVKVRRKLIALGDLEQGNAPDKEYQKVLYTFSKQYLWTSLLHKKEKLAEITGKECSYSLFESKWGECPTDESKKISKEWHEKKRIEEEADRQHMQKYKWFYESWLGSFVGVLLTVIFALLVLFFLNNLFEQTIDVFDPNPLDRYYSE